MFDFSFLEKLKEEKKSGSHLWFFLNNQTLYIFLLFYLSVLTGIIMGLVHPNNILSKNI